MTIQATHGLIGGAVVETKEAMDAAAGSAISDILPEPDSLSMLAMSGDPGAELAALAVKSGEEQQTDAQAARHADQAIEVSEDQQQVNAMSQKADDIRSSGLASGLGMVAEGGLEFAAADVTESAATTGVTASSATTGAATSGGVADVMSPSAKAALESAGLRLDGTLLKAAGSINASGASASEANEDASAAAAKSASDQAKSAADDENDAKKSAGDFINAAIDFYKEYTSAQASANSAALHRA